MASRDTQRDGRSNNVIVHHWCNRASITGCSHTYVRPHRTPIMFRDDSNLLAAWGGGGGGGGAVHRGSFGHSRRRILGGVGALAEQNNGQRAQPAAPTF